jgi:hypothetical protein
MSDQRNTIFIRSLVLVVLSFCAISAPAWPQQTATTADQRDELQQILTQTYQPSLVGKGIMGVGSATAIRRAGAIVVVERPGLFGSIDHDQIAMSTIRGLDASLYRGHKDFDVPVGERFYVFNISVFQDGVTFALLSARIVNGPKGPTRMWTALSFFFPPENLAHADKDVVFRGIDSWLALEGHSQVTTVAAPQALAAPVAVPASAGAPAQSAPVPPAAERTPGPPAKLTPGMTRDEIVAALGVPQREMSFEGRSWLTYPNMVLVLEGGKLTSIDSAGQPPAKVAVHSDPAGAEIYLDGQLIGSTPSTVELPAGTHELSVRLSGYQDWVRSLRVLSGSEINLDAKLDKK